MEFLSRHRFALGFALVLCLVLVGRWAMFQHEAVNAPATVERLASSDGAHEAAPPPIVEAETNTAPPAEPASSAGALRGRVIDAVTRQPVREFELKFQDIERGYASAQTRTFRAADGRFEWRRVLPEHWILVANARGYQRFELNNSQVASGKVAPELVLPLRPGRKLQGRVYDEISRIGISAASISFRDANVGRFEGNWRSRAGTTSRKDGSFVLDGVPSGRITLQIDAQDYAGRELDGTSTAGKGEYVIEDLAAGEYTLLVDSYASRPVQVSGDTRFDIDAPLTNLSGRVLEAASQVPVVEADVDIWSAQTGSSPIRLDSRSDHFGQFAFAGLEPGDFILTAYKPGYEMVRQRISYSAPTSGLTISLRQSRGVEITVREAGSGKPLRQVEALEMIGDGNGSKLQLRLDENGIGYIPEALTGSTLSFSAYRYAPNVIRAWSGQELDVQLSRQAR